MIKTIFGLLFTSLGELCTSQPYDFLALIPVIEGSGGVITDWKGHQLRWEASPLSIATSIFLFNISHLKLFLIPNSFLALYIKI
jgi:fructose-1,6-bisphosphatase/inositol monophosphatase family enzyme